MPIVRNPTQNEQLFLELVNRARLDPAAEAARYGIGLNDSSPRENDPPSSLLTPDPKQPLAHDPDLALAAMRHSDDMLERNYFAHTALSPAPHGTTPKDRMETAGYNLSGSWATGENIAWSGTTGTLDLDESLLSHHEGLFKSVSHRENILQDIFRETGIAQVEGVFRANVAEGVERDYNASMLTHKFATSGSGIFLTGVAYTDLDGNDFYSLGESEPGLTLSAAGVSAQTATAGGYALALASGTTQVGLTYIWDGLTRTAMLDMDGRNAKIDIVGGTRLLSSGDLTLGDGVVEGGLLGAGNLILTGNGLDNLLIVGGGDNMIDGGGGHDIARFSGALTDFDITRGGEAIIVTDTRSAAELNEGTNTLTSIEILRFSDGDYLAEDLLDPLPPSPGDAQVILSGHLRDLSGNDLAGASVIFTPHGVPAATLENTADTTGRFELELAGDATGRLDAVLSHATEGPAISAGDALDVLRVAVGLDPSFGPAQAQNFVAADLTGDGRVTAGDALELLRHAVGLDSQHSPAWAFFDASLDWTALDIDRNSVAVERGIDIAALGTDLDRPMTGILLGNMESV
ncbi:MAG: CAP domain-containing protein [Roseovarius sp.]